jgi:glycosyltransferase involved in cell wall biosynthesis
MKNEISVFVLLARGFGSSSWYDRWQKGKIIGLNEPFPYGYHRAAGNGMTITFSEDCNENLVQKFFRLGVRAALGFDAIHAIRHREAIRNADAVWTHTESQSLAVALILLKVPKFKRPVLIFQSVWLMDKWRHLGYLRQLFYSRLLSTSDILSFHSSLNLSFARSIFPRSRCELILFGINNENPQSAKAVDLNSMVSIIAPGNDRHRDWKTLIAAVREMPNVQLTIVSKKCPKSVAAGALNIKIMSPDNNNDLLDLYSRCDGVIVPLRENMHASGITVVEEATQRGRPVIATDVGGLRDYFSDSEVSYFSAGDVSGLRSAINELASDPEASRARVYAAQAVMGSGKINAECYALQHAKWTRELINLRRCSVGESAESN